MTHRQSAVHGPSGCRPFSGMDRCSWTEPPVVGSFDCGNSKSCDWRKHHWQYWTGCCLCPLDRRSPARRLLLAGRRNIQSLPKDLSRLLQAKASSRDPYYSPLACEDSHASSTFTISPTSQSRSVTFAAIAGVVRSACHHCRCAFQVAACRHLIVASSERAMPSHDQHRCRPR